MVCLQQQCTHTHSGHYTPNPLYTTTRSPFKPFPKLDLPSLLECVEVPANKGVIVRVGIGGDE